jgi:hypothetical protein
MNRSLFALVFTCLVVSLPVRAAEPHSVHGLDLSVRDVTIDGTWRTADVPGVYRIVIATQPDGRTAQLFIQWLAAPTGTVVRLVESVEIVEVSELAVDIGNVEIEAAAENRLIVRFDAIDHDGHGALRLELTAEMPGRYRLVKTR